MRPAVVAPPKAQQRRPSGCERGTAESEQKTSVLKSHPQQRIFVNKRLLLLINMFAIASGASVFHRRRRASTLYPSQLMETAFMLQVRL
jgi:hypothetical protein